MLEKKSSFLKLLYFTFFRWNMWHLSKKKLIKILSWFGHEKTIIVYIPTLIVMSFILNHPSFTKILNGLELEYAPFYHCRKWSPILFVVKNWYSILIETINESAKSVPRHRILIYFTGNFFQCGISSFNQIMSSQHIYPLNCQDICSDFCSR